MNIRRFFSMFLCLLLLSAVTPIVSGSELSIVATADSYTESDEPDVNHGGHDLLYSYNYEWEYLPREERHVWLKFDPSKIPSDATVNSIILRMHTSWFGTTSTNKVGVFLCPNSNWQEMEITWNNCPQVTGQPIDTVYVGSTDTYYDFDVTSAVKGKNVVTLVLKTLESTDLLGYAIFDSKESYWNEERPRLIVEYTRPSPPLDVTSLIIGLIVIIAVVILVGYAVMRKKKQPSPPTTPPIPPSTPSNAHNW